MQVRDDSSHTAQGSTGDFRTDDFQDSFLEELVHPAPLGALPLPGERLGGLAGHRYEIEQSLGGGGMGQVFRALDHELQRTVALKFLLPWLSIAEPQREQLLREEAKAIARLDHECIVRIHDVSEWRTAAPEEGAPAVRVPFLVMEYLEGESLGALLRRERPSLERALEWMVDVAAGLAHAHERNLVHRDLKPGNVFVLTHGRAKLLDFGLSRLMVGASSNPILANGGTPGYMSPEQWRRFPADPRDDTWAAGLVLFELLTGERPFPRATREEVRMHVTSSEPMPSVRERHPELPREVEALVASLLAKNAVERCAHGGELLQRLQDTQEQLALRPSRGRPPVAEQRQVTLLACRLVPTSSDAEAMEPEDASEVQSSFHRAVAQAVRHYGGTLASCLGPEVLACFGYPRVSESDTEQAVRAALHLHAVLPRELPALERHSLEVRVGLHTDRVAFSEASRMMAAMQGEAPEVAAWLTTQATPGGVLLSERTWRLVAGSFHSEPLGPRAFSGLAGTREVGLFLVHRERYIASRFDRALIARARSPLVGREHELRWLSTRWEESLPGRGAFLLLRGEAGVGKSRLVQELHDRAPTDASSWVLCQCWLQFKNTAFYPFTDGLRRFLRLPPEALAPEALAPEASTLRDEPLRALGLAPEHASPLRALFFSLPADAPFRQLSPERQRQRLLEALLALLRKLACQHPLTLVVEDLHWADPSTLQFLDFLRQHLHGLRACILGTVREDFPHAWAGSPGFEELHVRRLPPSSALELTRQLTRDRTLPADTLEQLVERTDGMPLFIEEMTRAVLEQGGRGAELMGAPSGPIPATLHELLLARLDRLSSRHKALAQLAATLGRDFSQEMIEAVSFLEPQELREALEQLEQAGLLFRQGKPPRVTYTFKHALIQNAAYQSMLRGTRQRFHARIAQALSQRFTELAREQPALLAQHLSLAGQLEQSLEQWCRAARLAETRSAIPEAINHFQRALGQLARLPASRSRDQKEISLRAELGHAIISAKGYASREAEQVYSHAYALCEQTGDVPTDALSGLWAVALARGDQVGTSRLVASFQRLLEGQADLEQRAVAHASLTMWNYFHGEHVACHQHGLAVRALFHEHWGKAWRGPLNHVTDSLLHALLFLGKNELARARPALARELCQEALAFAQAACHPPSTAMALLISATLEMDVDRVYAMRVLACQAMHLAKEGGFPYILAGSRCVCGVALMLYGSFEKGIAELRGGLELIKSMGAWTSFPRYATRLAEAYLRCGQWREGLVVAQEGVEMVERGVSRCHLPELRLMQARLLWHLEDETAAGEHLRQALAEARSMGALLPELRAATTLVELLEGSAEGPAAHARLEEVCARLPEEAEELEDVQSARALLGTLGEEEHRRLPGTTGVPRLGALVAQEHVQGAPGGVE